MMSTGLESISHTQVGTENILNNNTIYSIDHCNGGKEMKTILSFWILLLCSYQICYFFLELCKSFFSFHSLPFFTSPSQFHFSKFYPFHNISITISYILGGFLGIFNLYLTHFLFDLMYIDFLALTLFSSSQ